MRKVLKRVVAVFLMYMVILNLILISAVATGPITEGTYRIRTMLNTDKVLDVCGASSDNGTNIEIYTYHGGANQKFDIYHVSGGWYKIIDHCSGKSIDVAGGVKGNEVNVQLYEYNGSKAQLWSFISAGNGSYYIKNKLGYYLDVYKGRTANKTNVQVYQKHGGNNQKWKLSLTADEQCIISSAIDFDYVLDVYKSNTSNGTNVQLYKYHGGTNQKYYIVHRGGGWYAILNIRTKKAIDVSGGVKRSGVNVQLYDINYSDAQLWKFIDAGGGCYYIKNKLGYYLDVSGGNAKNESNVQVYSGNGTRAQKWRIERLGVVDPYKKTTEYKTKTVSLSFNSIDSWVRAYKNAFILVTFGNKMKNFPLGEIYYSGNVVVGLKVLQMKSIKSKVSTNTPGRYDNITIRMPSKIQFMVHRHSNKSASNKFAYFSGDSITIVMECSCGLRGETVMKSGFKNTYAPQYKKLWNPRFYD